MPDPYIPGEDPGHMDGEAIAKQILGLCHSEDVTVGLLSLWTGIALARLLEYQRKLEALGELPAPQRLYQGLDAKAGGDVP